MAYEVFQKENEVILKAQKRLDDGVFDEATQPHYEKLLSDYQRLLKISRRMMTLSETNENKLREANDEIARQHEELERRQQELVQSEKMAALGQLVAGVAHELNTPLGIILTSATSLQAETTVLEKRMSGAQLRKSDLTRYMALAQEASALMARHSDTASDLIRSFKAVSVDQVVEDVREINLVAYIQDVFKSLMPTFKGTSISLRCVGDTSLKVTTSPGPFSMVLTNLILNAHKHGFNNGTMSGEIEVICKRDDDEGVFIIVKDNGSGIDPTVESTLFDPFVTTARENGGTGLGLHLVHNMMSVKLKGRIRLLQKETEGKGCAFELFLPFNL